MILEWHFEGVATTKKSISRVENFASNFLHVEFLLADCWWYIFNTNATLGFVFKKDFEFDSVNVYCYCITTVIMSNYIHHKKQKRIKSDHVSP